MIQQTEIDGVPVLFSPRPGRLAAGLVFRVGMADETLPSRGVTHLVEHLALHHHGLTDYHFNGATGRIHTHFYMEGAESDVVSYLTGVCDSLLNLPIDRLQMEKDILRTEEAGRGRAATNDLDLWRYGAQGYGLSAYPEWGVPQLRPEDVRQWAETWFVAGNAVLWVAGDRIPTGLRLRLRPGAHRPVPPPTSALPETPAYFSSGQGAVLFDAVVRRSTSALLTADVLERELFRTLRQEGGYSYTAATAYEPRGDGFATITALADALRNKQDAVLGGFVDVLAKLAAGRIEPADLESARTKLIGSFSAPEGDAARLRAYAADLLGGQPISTAEQVEVEAREVGPEDVHLVVKELMGTALLQVPEGHSADWAGYAPAPTVSTHTVSGTHYPARDKSASAIVIGRDGVSRTTAAGLVTVRFAECAAKLTWPDGGRALIGRDGITVAIEPTLYAIDPNALASLDAQVHPASVIWMPPRPPGAIPGPQSAATAATSRSVAPPGRFELPILIVCGILATMWGLITLLTTLVAFFDPTSDLTDWASWFVLGFVWLIQALVTWPVIKITRRRRSRRP